MSPDSPPVEKTPLEPAAAAAPPALETSAATNLGFAPALQWCEGQVEVRGHLLRVGAGAVPLASVRRFQLLSAAQTVEYWLTTAAQWCAAIPLMVFVGYPIGFLLMESRILREGMDLHGEGEAIAATIIAGGISVALLGTALGFLQWHRSQYYKLYVDSAEREQPLTCWTFDDRVEIELRTCLDGAMVERRPPLLSH